MNRLKEIGWYKMVVLLLLFALMYGFGHQVAEVEVVVSSNFITSYDTQSWGLGFGEDGTTPTGNTSSNELEAYDAYYVGDETEKVLYLTFDAGYENGYTEMILDALAASEVSATFFLVGNYLETNPELVIRMVEEGHTVANHSYYHPDMTTLSEEDFIEELEMLEIKFKEITGEELATYYRPPQGKYSVDTLELAQSLGYKTIFWSLAYVDWYVDDQPTYEEAFDKLLGRIHPGAIVLLHSTSQTNGEILPELLEEWANMGYRFGTLDELA